MWVRIAVVGGTGRFGSALARALADAGHHTIIGSRSALRACNMAGLLGAQAQSAAVVEGALNPDAVRAAEIVLVAIPAQGHAAILRQLALHGAGRVFIDTCVCHDARQAGVWRRPREGSAAARARRLLPPNAAVAATLHAVPAAALRYPERTPVGHVPYCADTDGAADAAATVLRILGLTPLAAGGLHAAGALEHLAVLCGALADAHGRHPGVRFLGLEADAERPQAVADFPSQP